MSEKRSWDIQPKRKVSPPVQQRVAAPEIRRIQRSEQRPAQRPPERAAQRSAQRPVVLRAKEKPMPEPQARAIKRQPAVPKGKDREPLKNRRKRQRRRTLTILVIVVLLCIGGVVGGLWWNGVRIQHIHAAGPDSDAMQTIAGSVLTGTYHFIIPRDSIFFFPQQEIRTAILQQYPDISAVSISRASFNTIDVSSIPREAALTWCGATYSSQMDASSTQSSCYSADAQGVIFASIGTIASTSETLRLFGDLSGTDLPLGQTIAQASYLPNALQFVKAIKSLGVPIVSLVLRGDEADLYAQSGTRITYVLGQEEVSAQTAESAFPSLNMNDGSLEYVDLRFAGKAYFKKYNSRSTGTASSTSSH